MLYKKIVTVSLAVYAFLTNRSLGATYYATTFDGTCTAAGPGDICDYTCDQDSAMQSFDCGTVSQCIIHCEAKRCMESSTITATNADNFNFVGGIINDCAKSSIVYLPANGDATLIVGNSNLKDSTIYAGPNTGDIYIDCNFDGNDDCRNVDIHAQTARSLYIYVGNGQLGGGAGDTDIYCPVDSDYIGPEAAPCVIELADGSDISNVNLYAANGVPMDLYFKSTGTTTYADVTTLTASNVPGCTTAQMLTSTPDSSSPCWNTEAPTPQPTNPTTSPTTPTMVPTNPTSIPTFNPTTAVPTTNVPTTSTPTTKQPTSAPVTNTPTRIPTEHEIPLTVPPTTLEPTTSEPTTDVPTTLKPVTSTTVDITTQVEDTEGADEFVADSSSSNIIYIIVGIICGIVLTVIIGFIVYKRYLYKKIMKETETQTGATHKLNSVSMEGDTNNDNDIIRGIDLQNNDMVPVKIIAIDGDDDQQENDLFMKGNVTTPGSESEDSTNGVDDDKNVKSNDVNDDIEEMYINNDQDGNNLITKGNINNGDDNEIEEMYVNNNLNTKGEMDDEMYVNNDKHVTQGLDNNIDNELQDWLTDIVGLPQYYNTFFANAINLELAEDLTDDVLKEIGVIIVGHRMKILKHAKQLKQLAD